MAAVTLCEAAAMEVTPSQTVFIKPSVVTNAEAWGGAAFTRDVSEWLGDSIDPAARTGAARVVYQDCERLGGFLKS